MSQELQRLLDHPTPWWSGYALRHPRVALRTLTAYAPHDALLDNTLTACALAAFAMSLVLGLAWFAVFDPRFHARMPSMWIVSTLFTLVVMPPAYGIVFTQLRYAYQTVMRDVHRRHPGAFLAMAHAGETGGGARASRT